MCDCAPREFGQTGDYSNQMTVDRGQMTAGMSSNVNLKL